MDSSGQIGSMTDFNDDRKKSNMSHMKNMARKIGKTV